MDMIKETDPTIMRHSDNGTWVYYNPLPLLKDNNSTVDLQKGCRLSRWFTTEDNFFTKASITFLNVDNIKLYTDGNTDVTIAIGLFQPQMRYIT